MAKWGEGDPRWVVEEREDGTNVNNWHWSEKNATEWSRSRLTELLLNLAFEEEGVGSARISEITGITGEATANNRKSKLIFFYELVIKAKWKGETADGTAVLGTLTIPNLSEENSMDEIDVEVDLTSDRTPGRDKVKQMVRSKSKPVIQDQLAKWLSAMKDEFAQGLIKPTGQKSGQTAPAKAAGVKLTDAAAVVATPVVGSGSAGSVEYKTLALTDTFKCRAMDLFQAMLDESRVKAYTQSDCKIDSKVGGQFSLFSGNITGTFKELIPGERIEQAWRMKHWPDNVYSHVSLKIEQLDDECKITLAQDGIPAPDYESVKTGWRSHQWERMKAILGFGTGFGFSF